MPRLASKPAIPLLPQRPLMRRYRPRTLHIIKVPTALSKHHILWPLDSFIRASEEVVRKADLEVIAGFDFRDVLG